MARSTSLGLVLLLFASDASFAVARNLRLSAVLADRVPGDGAWIEGLLLASAAAVPRPVPGPLRVPRGLLQPRDLGATAARQPSRLNREAPGGRITQRVCGNVPIGVGNTVGAHRSD